MPDPRYVQPEPASVPPSPWAADLKPFKPYVYRGCGYDIYDPDLLVGDDDGDD